jgi:hypothetical protein
VIAKLPGPSGPIAFMPGGMLVYGENSPVFPAPPGSGSLYGFTAQQVAAAVGPTWLTAADAQPIAGGLDVLTDLVVDAEGDLVVSDSIHGRILEIDPVSGMRIDFGTTSYGGVTYLAVLDDGATSPAILEPFQPEAGGTIAAITSDYFTVSELELVDPRRPTMTAMPAGPIPAGSFTVGIEKGPPLGIGILLASLGSIPEQPILLSGTPFFFGLDPATTVAVGTLVLDAQGGLALPAVNPGLSLTVHVQTALLGPVGTTTPLALALQ